MAAAKTSVQPLLTRKPVVRPLADGSFDVKLPCGGRLSILPVENRDGSAGWWVRVVGDDGEPTSVRVPSCAAEGNADSPERAIAYGWAAAFRADSLPAWGTAEAVHELARECNSDRGLLVKTIKRIARERFGVTLSVRGSTGTGYGWVSASPSHDGEPTPAERIVMGFLEGHPSDSASIRPCGGARVAAICSLAGHPLPEGFKVQAPQWD